MVLLRFELVNAERSDDDSRALYTAINNIPVQPWWEGIINMTDVKTPKKVNLFQFIFTNLYYYYLLSI